MQTLSLSGVDALTNLTRKQAWFAGLFGCLGSGLLVVALAIAANYANTDDLDSIELITTALTITFANLMAIVLVALCMMVAMKTGDRLVSLFGRLRSGLMLAGVCFLGLFLGGLMGLFIAKI